MFDWQLLGVAAIVGGAVAFMVQRFVRLRRAGRSPARSFVPLASLRRKKGGGCH